MLEMLEKGGVGVLDSLRGAGDLLPYPLVPLWWSSQPEVSKCTSKWPLFDEDSDDLLPVESGVVDCLRPFFSGVVDCLYSDCLLDPLLASMLNLRVSCANFSISGSRFDLEFLGEAKGDFPGVRLIRGLVPILDLRGSGGAK